MHAGDDRGDGGRDEGAGARGRLSGEHGELGERAARPARPGAAGAGGGGRRRRARLLDGDAGRVAGDDAATRLVPQDGERDGQAAQAAATTGEPAAAVSASMVRSASSTTALKLSPSRRSSPAAVSSICRWSVSSWSRSREVKSFRVEVMLVQRSLRPPPLPALRGAGGYVVLALARHVESRVFEGGDDIGAVAHATVLDALHQVVSDHLARVGLHLQAGSQIRRPDVGAVARLLHPRPRRVVGPAPAVLVAEGVTQRVEGLLPAGRRDVQAAARLQVAPCCEDVHMDPAAVLAVQDRRPRVSGPRGVPPRPPSRTRRGPLRSARRPAEGGGLAATARRAAANCCFRRSISDKRAQLGAHYTDCEICMQIVEPVLIHPWLAEWAVERPTSLRKLDSAEVATSPATRTKRRNEAERRYRTFLNRLRRFTVLDPACCSGKLLYLALQARSSGSDAMASRAPIINVRRGPSQFGVVRRQDRVAAVDGSQVLVSPDDRSHMLECCQTLGCVTINLSHARRLSQIA